MIHDFRNHKMWWHLNKVGEPEALSIVELEEVYGVSDSDDDSLKRWHEHCVVKQETISGVFVSTVVLKMSPESLLSDKLIPTFETITQTGDENLNESWNIHCRCHGTREQAEAMHEKVAKKVRSKCRNT